MVRVRVRVVVVVVVVVVGYARSLSPRVRATPES